MNKQYYLNTDGSFVIEDYQHKKVFSNFFPGVAGLWGVPMWAFYVNRGQAISSFGIESKDKAILEFQPANRAYRLTSIQGFRTFLKISGKKGRLYEPFTNSLVSPYEVHQRMIIKSHDLTIEETNITLGLRIQINYLRRQTLLIAMEITRKLTHLMRTSPVRSPWQMFITIWEMRLLKINNSASRLSIMSVRAN